MLWLFVLLWDGWRRSKCFLCGVAVVADTHPTREPHNRSAIKAKVYSCTCVYEPYACEVQLVTTRTLFSCSRTAVVQYVDSILRAHSI
jgi:hypothetical protein